MAVLVLQALAVERRAPGGRAEHEAARHLVAGRPEGVTGALEPEHRVEDVDRDHRDAVRRVGRRDRRPGRRRACLVDALVQDDAGGVLLVGEHELAVDRGVALAVGGVDLRGREQRVHAEGARLVGDDGNEPPADLGVLHQLLEQPHEGHRGGDLLLAGPTAHDVVDRVAGEDQRRGRRAARRQVAAQGPAPLVQVLDVGRVVAGVEVRRQRLVERLVGDVEGQPVAEAEQVVLLQLLHLVRRVAALEVRAEGPALDGLGEDDGRLAGVLGRGLVGGEHLPVVVPAAAQPPDLLVGHRLDHRAGAGIPAEEVLADEGAVLGLVGLVVAVRGVVHQVDQGAVGVLGQQGVPLAAPDHLDDVPAGAAEVGLELLDHLAVAPDRPVQALQVAVDDERQVVELLAGRHADRAERLRLVHLAVTEEGPHVLLAGVLDLAVVQVAVEPGLVDRVDRPEAHRHRRELPELRHQPRVRVRRQPAAGVRELLPEAVQLLLGEPALEERAGVHAGGGVPLVEDLVAAAGVVLAAEEVVEADLVERGGRGVGRDVAADLDAGALRPVHHDRGVPPGVGADALLDLLVAGEPRLGLGRDRVDVVGAAQARHADLVLAGPLEQAQHEVPGAVAARVVDDRVERLEPLGGLGGVDVGQLARQAVADDRGALLR